MSLSLSLKKNKQSGFTLIELMVVMAIIAILATAGLSAYTGYIKKARDAVRIADLNAINTIILGMLSINGEAPASILSVYNAIKEANNGQPLFDPQYDKPVCMDADGNSGKVCSYTYRRCDTGLGYAVGARLESRSNLGMYLDDTIDTAGAPPFYDMWIDNKIFEIGSCKNYCEGTGTGCTGSNPADSGFVMKLYAQTGGGVVPIWPATMILNPTSDNEFKLLNY